MDVLHSVPRIGLSGLWTRAEYESIKTDLDDIHTRLERIESLFDAMKAFMDVETTDSSTDEDNSE